MDRRAVNSARNMVANATSFEGGDEKERQVSARKFARPSGSSGSNLQLLRWSRRYPPSSSLRPRRTWASRQVHGIRPDDELDFGVSTQLSDPFSRCQGLVRALRRRKSPKLLRSLIASDRSSWMSTARGCSERFVY